MCSLDGEHCADWWNLKYKLDTQKVNNAIALKQRDAARSEVEVLRRKVAAYETFVAKIEPQLVAFKRIAEGWD